MQRSVTWVLGLPLEGRNGGSVSRRNLPFLLVLLFSFCLGFSSPAAARPIMVTPELLLSNTTTLLSPRRACVAGKRKVKPMRIRVKSDGTLKLVKFRKARPVLRRRCKQALKQADLATGGSPQEGSTGCAADLDGDLQAGQNDIAIFLSAWLARDPAIADWNSDGRINSNDISAYLSSWLNIGGCQAPTPTPTPPPLPVEHGWTEFTPTALDPMLPPNHPEQPGTRLIYVSKAQSPVRVWSADQSFSTGTVVLYPVIHTDVAGPLVRDAFWRADGSHQPGVPPGPGVSGWTAVRDPGQVYYWNGSEVVDESGASYGSDPFHPEGITSFYSYGTPLKERSAWGLLRSEYADWILFQRGESWTAGVDQFTSLQYVPGHDSEHPSLHTAFGSEALDRPKFLYRAGGYHDIYGNDLGASIKVYMRYVSRGNAAWTSLHFEPENPSSSSRGFAVDIIGFFPDQVIAENLLFEDLRIDGMNYGFVAQWVANLDQHPDALMYNLGIKIRRSVVTNIWAAGHHNQGLYVHRVKSLLVEDSIFARNGYKGDPRIDDRRRDIFSRNFYLGSYDQMGVTMRNVISALGGSGGPQMRAGGLIEDSLIMEGYWYSSTESNGNIQPWGPPQQGISAIVRNNVQFKVRSFGTDDDRAHPAWGYIADGGTFNSEISGNIISGRHLQLNGFTDEFTWALKLSGTGDVNRRTSRNTFRDNIAYLAGPLMVDRAESTDGNAFLNNTVVSNELCFAHFGSGDTLLSENRCYTNQSSPFQTNNGWHSYASFLGTGVSDDDGSWSFAHSNMAAASEGWPDPNRSVRSYLESRGLPVSTPDGVLDFLEDCSRQRKGFWRESCTARAVVNYVRAGFALPPLTAPEIRESEVSS